MVLKDNTKKKQSNKSPDPENMEGKTPSDTSKDQEGKKTGKQDNIDTLKEELETLNEKVLRVSAEFENFKKRKQKEIEDFRKFANESLFRQLLTVVDNLERAIDSAEGEADPKDLAEGIKLTHKELMKMFDTFNVKPIDAENNPFDPNFHQAVTQTETGDYPENTVITELQKGYMLNDRLLRPSMVVVSKNKEKTNKIK